MNLFSRNLFNGAPRLRLPVCLARSVMPMNYLKRREYNDASFTLLSSCAACLGCSGGPRHTSAPRAKHFANTQPLACVHVTASCVRLSVGKEPLLPPRGVCFLMHKCNSLIWVRSPLFVHATERGGICHTCARSAASDARAPAHVSVSGGASMHLLLPH